MKKKIAIKQVALSGSKKATVPDGALCDNLGNPIVTADGKYIIVNK